MLRFALGILILFVFCFSKTEPRTTSGMVKKYYLVADWSANYDSAFRLASMAGKLLDAPVELRGLKPDPMYGLTTDEICGCGEMHGYIPRGRFDDGDQVSIEFSSEYSFPIQNVYLVMVGSGDSLHLGATQTKLKDFFPGNTLFSDSVFMGCMH
ncbi:MAG: hypothetical protein H6605_05905 [Flavobacteriales bacterium]|nr:hypothetical protein [Flavobacteriales bacterium]